MRRASTVLINPARPGTPEQERGSSTDIERSEDDTASTTGKKPKRSRSNTSLSNIFTRSASPPPPQPGALAAAAAPSPIAESPAREAAAAQDESAAPPAAGAVKSPLSQEVKLAAAADPDPAAAPQTAASPTPAEYIPPPLIDNTATGPGGFTDDLDDLPSSEPIADPYAPPLSRSRSQASERPIERVPSVATQHTNPQSLNPTAQNSTDLLASSSGGDQESGVDKSAPIDIPQKTGTFFEHLRASPEDDDVVPPPATKELDLESEEPVEQTQEQPIDQVEQEREQEQQQQPRTPPRQVYLDTYTGELDHEPWSGEPGGGQRSVEETPMSIPPRPVARSLSSSDTSEEYVLNSWSWRGTNMIDLIASLRATCMKTRSTIRLRLDSPLNMGMAIYHPRHNLIGVLRWRVRLLQVQLWRWRCLSPSQLVTRNQSKLTSVLCGLLFILTIEKKIRPTSQVP